MSSEPKYLMTRKGLAEYVAYVNRGASADSKNMFLQQFKQSPLVTCGECEYMRRGGLCILFNETMNHEDFCSQAKRKEPRHERLQ